MKSNLLKWTLAVVAFFLIAGCGGGGGGGTEGGGGEGNSWMTVNVVSQTTPTVTNTYTGSLTTTPQLVSMVSGDQSLIQLITPTLQLNLCAGGAAAGSYPVSNCTDGGSVIDYILISGSTYTFYKASEYYPETSGAITLTSVGTNKDETVSGSFDAIVSNGTDTQRVWGSFEVTNI